MKKVLTAVLLLIGFNSFAQPCADEDTVRANAVSLITATSVRVNGTTSHFAGTVLSIQLRYVRVGFTDTATASASGTNALRNLTGLQSNTTYRYYYTSVCGSGTNRQLGTYTFTTATAGVVYTDERSTKFPYVAVDSGLKIPRMATLSLFRAAGSRGGDIAFRTTDSLPYYYNGATWKYLAVDSAGILPTLNRKVDSVTVSGDSLFYWVNGTGYGYILPNGNAWYRTGNSGTTAGTNFIGTTDDVDLVFKRNSVRSGLIGNLNTAFGRDSYNPSSSGNYNTALGVLTLINNTTGANNQAVGHSALQHNTTGIYNSAVGYTALQAGTTGSYNTALGSSALINNTTGANNIAVGYAAGARNTTLSNRLFIGSIARNDLNEDSTMALLFGYMDEDPALQKLVVNGKLGVGTSTPRGTLDVVGDETYLSSGYIEMGANAARFATMGTGSMTLGDRDNLFQGNNFTIDNGSDLNFFTNNSLDTKLGVNTAHPDSALHIVGGLKFVTGRQGAGKVLTSNASGGADWSTLSGAGIGTVTSVATGLGLSGGTITSTGTILLDTASSSVISRQRAAATYLPLAGGTLTGNLGIGVSPSYRLDVSGSTSTARFYDQTASTGRTQVRIRDGAGQSGNESLVIVENSDNPANNGIRFYAGAAFFNTSGIARYMNAGVDVMPSTGVYRWVNGTTNPFGTIDLSMSRVRAKWLAIGSSATVGDSTGSVTMDSLRVKSLAHFAGNVGIGTTSPTSLLHTAGSFATAYVAKTANYTATISDYTIHFTSGTSTFTLPTAVGITGRIYVVRNDSGNTLTLATTSSQTIDGAAPGTQATGTVKQYQSTGANWISLN